MSKNKILEKILAIILIFTLTSANFAFVTKSYATFAGGIFSGKSDTGNKNVEFEAYFKTGDEKAASAISDVNNKDLVIGMELNIKDSGYLKNAKVEIISEEGEKLNFDVIEKEELEEEVRSFENNTIYLNQINKSSEVKLEVPIKY